MPLPPRPFHILNDVAVRWSALPIDLVGWSTAGLLTLSAALPPVRTASSRMLSDIVEIAGTDVIPLFRLDGARLESVSIRRIRVQGETEWQWISEPVEGVDIAVLDFLITRAEVLRFEREHDLHRGFNVGESQCVTRRAPGPGAPPRYDWDSFFVALARRIFVQGLPSTQAELVREMLDWFQRRNNEPDESTVRRKVAMVWRELNRSA